MSVRRSGFNRDRASAIALAIGMLMASCGAGAATTCTVSVSGIVFGAYDRLSATPLDSMVTGTLTCTGAATISAILSKGLSGSYTTRQMGSNANRLNYNLYVDAARTTVWGDGTSGTVPVTATLPTGGGVFSGTVYGRIPAGQNVPAGAYSDTITVTVTYN